MFYRATTVTSTTPCLWTVTRLTYGPDSVPAAAGFCDPLPSGWRLKMTDEAGEDAKPIAVPHTS